MMPLQLANSYNANDVFCYTHFINIPNHLEINHSFCKTMHSLSNCTNVICETCNEKVSPRDCILCRWLCYYPFSDFHNRLLLIYPKTPSPIFWAHPQRSRNADEMWAFSLLTFCRIMLSFSRFNISSHDVLL